MKRTVSRVLVVLLLVAGNVALDAPALAQETCWSCESCTCQLPECGVFTCCGFDPYPSWTSCRVVNDTCQLGSFCHPPV